MNEIWGMQKGHRTPLPDPEGICLLYLFAQYFLIILIAAILLAHQHWIKHCKIPIFSLHVGDTVTTITGITGTITSIQGHMVVILKNDGQFAQALKLTIIDVRHE